MAEGVKPEDFNFVGDDVKSEPLKGDAGRYIGGPDRRNFLDQSLTPIKSDRVFSHEVGHLLDDMSMAPIGPGGSRIPTSGLSKERGRVYEDLNTAGWFKPGRGMTPKGQGYAANQTDAELMAEAVSAAISLCLRRMVASARKGKLN